MGVLDSILAAKPLKPWQAQIRDEGRRCQECGAEAVITAPTSDDADMVRIACPKCSLVCYEFPPHEPTIIKFEDLRGRFDCQC